MFKTVLISSLSQHKHDVISPKKMMMGRRGDSTVCHVTVARQLHYGSDKEAKGCPCKQEGFELFFYSCVIYSVCFPSSLSCLIHNF